MSREYPNYIVSKDEGHNHIDVAYVEKFVTHQNGEEYVELQDKYRSTTSIYPRDGFRIFRKLESTGDPDLHYTEPDLTKIRGPLYGSEDGKIWVLDHWHRELHRVAYPVVDEEPIHEIWVFINGRRAHTLYNWSRMNLDLYIEELSDAYSYAESMKVIDRHGNCVKCISLQPRSFEHTYPYV